MVDNSVHCHDHNHNHYHNHDQRKLSNEQLSNHDFLREQLDRVCKIARLAATASQQNVAAKTKPDNGDIFIFICAFTSTWCELPNEQVQ